MKKGRWIFEYISKSKRDFDYSMWCRCSECNDIWTFAIEEFHTKATQEFKYCPRCGAEMTNYDQDYAEQLQKKKSQEGNNEKL